MLNVKMRIAVALALVVLVAYVAPVWAVDYNPGVSVGQWVKYGNFFANGSFSTASLPDWAKIEVTEVSGKNITLHVTGKYTNGSDTPTGGMRVNVETGWTNSTGMIAFGGLFSYVIAANLQQGDNITKPTTPLPYILKINKTESRSYAGASRNVDILNITVSSYNFIVIWEQSSGMLMEMQIQYTIGSTTSTMSFSATDMGSGNWLMDNLIYIVIAAVVVVIIVVAAVIIMRRPKAPPPPAPEPKEASAPSET